MPKLEMKMTPKLDMKMPAGMRKMPVSDRAPLPVRRPAVPKKTVSAPKPAAAPKPETFQPVSQIQTKPKTAKTVQKAPAAKLLKVNPMTLQWCDALERPVLMTAGKPANLLRPKQVTNQGDFTFKVIDAGNIKPEGKKKTKKVKGTAKKKKATSKTPVIDSAGPKPKAVK